MILVMPLALLIGLILWLVGWVLLVPHFEGFGLHGCDLWTNCLKYYAVNYQPLNVIKFPLVGGGKYGALWKKFVLNLFSNQRLRSGANVAPKLACDIRFLNQGEIERSKQEQFIVWLCSDASQVRPPARVLTKGKTVCTRVSLRQRLVCEKGEGVCILVLLERFLMWRGRGLTKEPDEEEMGGCMSLVVEWRGKRLVQIGIPINGVKTSAFVNMYHYRSLG